MYPWMRWSCRVLAPAPQNAAASTNSTLTSLPGPLSITRIWRSSTVTALDPVASKLPDRARVCCAGRGAPLLREIVTGSGFRSPNQPDVEGDRHVPYQIRTGFALNRRLCYCRR